MVSRSSSLFSTVCERKFVSTRTEYGGARAVLYWKNIDDGACGTSRMAALRFFSARATASTSFFLRRASRWPMSLLNCDSVSGGKLSMFDTMESYLAKLPRLLGSSHVCEIWAKTFGRLPKDLKIREVRAFWWAFRHFQLEPRYNSTSTSAHTD